MFKDRDEDIPAEPEMIQAFRDTWELKRSFFIPLLISEKSGSIKLEVRNRFYY